MNFIYSLFFRYQQLIRYGIIGCLCVGIDLLIFVLLTQIINIPYLYANVFSVYCAISVSFFLNRYFTFKVKNKVILRLISFYLVGSIGLLISSGLLILFIERMYLNKVIAKVFTLACIALVQFLLNKNVSFKRKNDIYNEI
jgi:putative flippase GtrA